MPESAEPMRTAVLTGPRAFRIEDCAPPQPKPHQIRVRMQGCGLCASSLPVWQGRPWFSYPLPPGAPGHEGWGRIDAVGDGVHHLGVGARVAVVCERALSTHVVVDAAHAAVIPSTLAGQPVPGEPIGCAINIFRRSDIAAGHVVAIVGVGFLGALLTRLARDAGAHVIAVSRRPSSLDLALRYGAAEALSMDDPDGVRQRIDTLTDGAGCHRVIEAVGLQEPLTLATDLVGVRGRLIIAGFHQDGPRSIDMTTWNLRGIDVINAHERDPRVYVEGMRAGIEAVARGKIDPSPLYTHTFALDRLGDGFEIMAARADGVIKPLILI